MGDGMGRANFELIQEASTRIQTPWDEISKHKNPSSNPLALGLRRQAEDKRRKAAQELALACARANGPRDTPTTRLP